MLTPFFYEDQSAPRTFFVEPTLQEILVHEWEEYVTTTREEAPLVTPSVATPQPFRPAQINLTAPVVVFDPTSVIPDPAPIDRLFGDTFIRTSKGIFGVAGGVQTAVQQGVKVSKVFDSRKGLSRVANEQFGEVSAFIGRGVL